MSCKILAVDYKMSRFIKKFFIQTTISNEGCWIWNAGKQKNGYGYFWSIAPRSLKKITKAHRFSYELFVGEIPNGYVVCHKCDNPSCVNPDHLFCGTQAENVKDRDNKNRQSSGINHPKSKLNWDLVRSFRKDFSNGLTVTQISNKFGINHSTVSNVIKGNVWKNDPLEILKRDDTKNEF